MADAILAERGVFFRMPPGWFGDWHPTRVVSPDAVCGIFVQLPGS